MQTLKHYAHMAILAQDACNLSGVVHDFCGFLTRFNDFYPNASTDQRNQHPICRLFAETVAALSGMRGNHQDVKSYCAAYKKCKQLAEIN